MSKDDIKLIVVCYYEAFREYGHYLPDEVSDRLNSELLTIINNHESNEWCMLWWIWTHCSAAQNLTYSRGTETSLIAYLFGVSDYDPLGMVRFHFRKTSLFNIRRAFDLYYMLLRIREETDTEDMIDDEMLYHLAFALSPFRIEEGNDTLMRIVEDIHLDKLLDGKLDECDISDTMAMRSYMKELGL